MTSQFHITLQSPMGPREGHLRLKVSERGVTGTLALLGFEQPVEGEMRSDGRIRLSHCLQTAVSNMTCETVLHVMQDGSLHGSLHTGKERMRISGERESLAE